MIFIYFLLSVWTERRNKKEPRTRSAVELMGFPVSGCGTRGFAAHTVLARDDTEKPHLLPTAPAIVRPANTPPLVVADLRSGFDNDLFFFSDRFGLTTLELCEKLASLLSKVATLKIEGKSNSKSFKSKVSTNNMVCDLPLSWDCQFRKNICIFALEFTSIYK